MWQTLVLTLVECAIPLIVLCGLHRVAVRMLPPPLDDSTVKGDR
jgi:hypothetical protein